MKKSHRKRSLLKQIACLSVSLIVPVFFVATVNAQTATYTIAIKTADFSDAGTDDTVYGSITGNTGQTSRWFKLDKSGVNDFNRNTWTSYTFSGDMSGENYVDDIGWPVKLSLRLKNGKNTSEDDDDFCIRQMAITYSLNGEEIDIVQFMGTGPGAAAGQSCLGDYKPYADDASGPKMQRDYHTWSVMSDSVAQKMKINPLPKGARWEFMCSANSSKCEASSVQVFQLSDTLRSSWSKQTQSSVSRTISHTVTASYKQGGGATGAPEQSFQSSLTDSLSSAFTSTSSQSGGKDTGSQRSMQQTLTCAPPLNTTKDVYRMSWNIPFGAESIKYNECRWLCADTPPAPNAITIGEEKGSCKVN